VRLIVHGGAWHIPDDLAEASVNGVRNAARKGFSVLSKGGSAVDAVEAAVRVLEDDPSFDAGRGSCLNAAGMVEMDAMIMDGTTLDFGAVAAIQSVHNPVSVARQVMHHTPHCMLVGEGADAFARERNVPFAARSELVSQHAIEEYEEFCKFPQAVDELFHVKEKNREKFTQTSQQNNSHDTVGAVALDCEQRLAAATSTGGITQKRVGRVGDSPLVGSGAYADSEVGAVSCTGHGESIMKVLLAREVLTLRQLERCTDMSTACKLALEKMRTRTGGAGGAIGIDKAGSLGYAFTTERMAWASIEPGKTAGEFVLRGGIETDSLAFEEIVHVEK